MIQVSVMRNDLSCRQSLVIMRSLVLIIGYILVVSQVSGQLDIARLCALGKSHQKHSSLFSTARQTDNQHDYDVFYYGLNLTLLPDQAVIDGEVSVGLMVIEDSIDRVELDLTDNFTIDQIMVAGNPADFVHQSDLLVIDLGGYIENGSEIEIQVQYRGKPETSSFNFDERNGQPLIWSLSEPYGAREWWPCKDYPFDKADSATIKITVPEGLVAGSNGTLTEENTANGFTSFTWKEQYPITTYLISVAVHPYEIARDYFHYNNEDSMEVVHYIFPDHFEQVVDDYDKTVDMLEYFSEIFGLYPFIEEKYGHAEFPWGGGMEHQTLTSLLGPYEYLIAHELAHQWWGNMITCKDFHHIWLNEGFATYTEALWAEFSEGTEAYHNYMSGNAYFGEGSIYVPDLSNDGRIFSGSLSYNKASWVLHMLRHVVGDDMFFDILKAYGDSSRKYGVATTEQFRGICEDVSGKELNAFFEQWIYGENHPIYAYEWSAEPENGQYILQLNISQQQATPIFEMPIDLLIEMDGSDTLIVVQNKLSIEDYQFVLPSEPMQLTLDPNNWILKKVLFGRNLINHNNNNLLVSLADNGSVGFDAPNGNGIGLIYPHDGSNLLYYGTPVLSVGTDYLADNDINGEKTVFGRKEGTSLFLETETEHQQGKFIFDNSSGMDIPFFEVEQISSTYDNVEMEDILLLNYKIYNRGNTDQGDIYFGLLLDADIGYYLDNVIEQDLERKLIYQENEVSLGIKSLNHHDFIQLTGITDPLDHFVGTDKFSYLRGERDDFLAESRDDWAMLISVGPFDLKKGNWINIPLAIIGAEDEDSLLEKADFVQLFYDLYSGNQPVNLQPEAKLAVQPNPVTDNAECMVKGFPDGDLDLYLSDVLGNPVNQWSMQISKGVLLKTLDFSFLPSGMYYLTAACSGVTQTISVVKQ